MLHELTIQSLLAPLYVSSLTVAAFKSYENWTFIAFFFLEKKLCINLFTLSALFFSSYCYTV